MFGYRPESINRDLFFQEVNNKLSKAISKYENIMLIGDLNIDLNIPNNDKHNYLNDLCDVFNLNNLIKNKTCDKSKHGTSIDVILTNKSRSFQKTTTIETGLSDHHKLILTFFKTTFQKLKPKNITFRDMKKFDVEAFLNDVDQMDRFDNSYHGFVTLYKSIIDRHGPMKTKTVR